jgi:hypothetical protein
MLGAVVREGPGAPFPRLLGPAAAVVLAAVIVLCAPWRIQDTDTLTNIAIGRLIVETGGVPRTDPFTFSDPGRRWSNPEWLGDVAWYAAWRAAGERGVVALALALTAVGFGLCLLLGRRTGGGTALTLALLLAALPGTLGRLVARNHLHAFWLIPLLGLALATIDPGRGGPAPAPGARAALRWLGGEALRQWRAVALVSGLLVLWANLHASFVLGWVVLAAALAQSALERDGRGPRVAAIGLCLLLAPALGMASPQGMHNYGQLVDHLRGAETYRALIFEWRSPGALPSGLVQWPLHLLGVVGLLSFLPACNRRRVGAFILLGVGLALAHRSQRFIPEFAVLAVPGIAGNLARAVASWRPRAARLVVLAAFVAALPPLGLAIRAARRHPVESALARVDAPLAVARFVRENAPRSRLVNPVNAAPWLLFAGEGRFQIYLDLRNNLGAAALRRYLDEILPRVDRFEAEVARLDVDLALVHLPDPASRPLAVHLGASPAWALVFLDGHHALYARRGARQEALIARASYRLLRVQPGLEYLLDFPADGVGAGLREPERLADEEARLRSQGPALADVLAAYRLLSVGGRPPPLVSPGAPTDAARRAAALLEPALPRLPRTGPFMSYLATAWARLGDRAAAERLAAAAHRDFPADPLVALLRAELADAAGRTVEAAALREAVRRQAPAGHPLTRILALPRSPAPIRPSTFDVQRPAPP